MTPPNATLLTAAFVLAAPFGLLAAPQKADKIDFAKQIQPIFEAHCYGCHGVEEQEADLRLDQRSSVFHEGGADQWVIVPGKAEKSELYARITLPADDPDVMPNDDDPLSGEQIAIIRAWIDQGAEWPEDSGAPAAEPAKPLVQPIVLPELSEADLAGQEKAVDAIRARGALAIRVAANTPAIDVNFSLVGPDIRDGDLSLLDGLETSMIWLNLSRTAVTDEGLAVLADCKQLRRLNLARTSVGDTALRHLEGLDQLEYLNLYGTAVTDAGLDRLRGLSNLKKLYLWQTEVTDEGASELQAALPGLKIDLGRYADEILAVAKARTPVNDRCPITDKPVVPAYVYVHDGKPVGFCCEKCLAKFAKEPAKFADKVGAKGDVKGDAKGDEPAKQAEASGPVNDKCPLTGKPVDPDQTFTYQDRVIGFCCGRCRAKFAADPAKFADKIAK